MNNLKRVGFVCVGLALAFSPVPLVVAADSGEGKTVLGQFNQTWQEAKCRNRIAMVIKKGKDRDGWSKSPWMCETGAGSKKESFCFRFKVSDRQALLPLIDGKTLRVGARFVADGWTLENPGAIKGLSLDLRFVDVPVKARFVFFRPGGMGATGIGPVERVMNIERYMRFDAFEVRPPDERIEPVAAPIVVAPPAPGPLTTPVQVRPELRLMAASVEPARVAAGETVRLIAIYAVEGLPADAVVNVREWRTIRQGERTLTTTDASVQQGPGIHQSSQPLQVPAILTPGVYELLVTIELQGSVKEATAVFEVFDRVP